MDQSPAVPGTEGQSLQDEATQSTHDRVVYIVDDDELFVRATSRLLKAVGYDSRSFTNVGDFLLSPVEERNACILLDVRMPGPSGLDLQKALQSRPYHAPIIFLSGYGDIPSTVRAMKEGAVDFLTKPVAKETLVAAVQNALKLDVERRESRRRLRIWQESFQTLTERERQVFDGVVAGKLNKQIAAELGAAERTVKLYRAHMMEKLKIHSVAELVRVAEQLRAGTQR
jgi:FixJ family two-component response regulator